MSHVSVSAELWCNIEEVPENALMQYIQDKTKERMKDIQLSVSSRHRVAFHFIDLNFQKRSFILLGREREGLPVEYVYSQAIDSCVEIPQLGIIRSLNVHVSSAAIMLFEFTRQTTTPQEPR